MTMRSPLGLEMLAPTGSGVSKVFCSLGKEMSNHVQDACSRCGIFTKLKSTRYPYGQARFEERGGGGGFVSYMLERFV